MSPSRWVAAWLCCLAQPALAQAEDPRIGTALAARDAGQTAEAIPALEALVAERPDDPIVLRLLGTAYAAARRYDEAAATLARAHRLAPADQDIALAQARVELWAGRPARAQEIADQIARVEPNNPELAELRTAIRNARPDTRRIGFGATYGVARVALEGPNRTWHEASIAIDASVGRDWSLSAEIDRSDREIAIDTRLSVRVDRRFGNRGNAYLAVSTTPDADFRERWSLRAGGEARLAPSVTVTLDARHANFGPADITAIEPGVRLETRDGRYSISARSINLWDEVGRHRNGWAGRIDAMPTDRLSLFAGAATYPDTEAGVTRRVDAAFGGVGITVARNLSVRLTAEYERRAQSYRRSGVSISLRWRLGP